ncbi:MAG: hypothetical protein ACI4B3_04900 [Prevotella sp.]
MNNNFFRHFTVAVALAATLHCHAQAITDSLAEDFRTIAAKNFSRYRTVNLSWEMKTDHDYTLNIGVSYSLFK